MKFILTILICLIFYCPGFAEELSFNNYIVLNDSQYSIMYITREQNIINIYLFSNLIKSDKYGTELKDQFYKYYDQFSNQYGKGKIYESTKNNLLITEYNLLELLFNNEYFLLSNWDYITIYCKAFSKNMGYIIIQYKLKI